MPKNPKMNDSQFELITLGDATRSRCTSTRTKQSSSSYDSTDDSSSSMRSSYLDMEDREMAHVVKRIEKLDAEIRANENVEEHVRALRERIDVARRSAAITIATLNEKMDVIEQAWDDQIIQEQKAIANEVLTLLKDLKEEELSQALSWRKKRRSSKGRSSRRSSSRSTTASRSQSASSVGSSSFSKKIAHLDRKERQFAGGAAEVKKDARQIDAMSRNLDSLNELERVVCNKLGRLQSVGDVKPGSSVYGTVELVENYKNSVAHLAKAIRSLSDVSCLPAITNDDPITKAEIDKICSTMTEFMGRIKAQIPSTGPSAENTPSSRPQTGVRVAMSYQKSRTPKSPKEDSESGDRSFQRPRPPKSPKGDSASGSESGASYASARGARSTASSSSVAASTAQSIESHHG